MIGRDTYLTKLSCVMTKVTSYDCTHKRAKPITVIFILANINLLKYIMSDSLMVHGAKLTWDLYSYSYFIGRKYVLQLYLYLLSLS